MKAWIVYGTKGSIDGKVYSILGAFAKEDDAMEFYKDSCVDYCEDSTKPFPHITELEVEE